MSKELIERLRELSKRRCIGTYDEAADRIEELEREVERKMSAADFILKERDALQADNARLRGAMEEIRDDFDCDNDAHRYGATCRCCLAEKTLTSTHEQSLAAYRNKVIEECAKRAEAYAYMSQNFNELAEELRAMKEPE